MSTFNHLLAPCRHIPILSTINISSKQFLKCQYPDRYLMLVSTQSTTRNWQTSPCPEIHIVLRRLQLWHNGVFSSQPCPLTASSKFKKIQFFSHVILERHHLGRHQRMQSVHFLARWQKVHPLLKSHACQKRLRAQKRISGPPPLIRFSDLAESESDDGFEVLDRSWESVKSRTSQPALTIESDASDMGWGATCLSPKDATGGLWSSQERLLHINCKELLATWLGLQCYAKNTRNWRVHLKIDNTAAVAYINKMGGTPSRDLCQLALRSGTGA